MLRVQVQVSALVTGFLLTSSMLTMTACSKKDAVPVSTPYGSGTMSDEQRQQQQQSVGSELTHYDAVAFQTALDTIKSNYESKEVQVSNLVEASKQLAEINAHLTVKGEYENPDDVKAILREADKIINHIDLGDPQINAEGKDMAITTLEETQTALDTAMGYYKLDKTEVSTERIDMKESYSGSPGDTLQIVPHLYPTFVEDTALEWGTDNAQVATVTNEGDITLINAGTAVITVTETNSGTQATIKVTVSKRATKPPTSQANNPKDNGGTANTQQQTTPQAPKQEVKEEPKVAPPTKQEEPKTTQPEADFNAEGNLKAHPKQTEEWNELNKEAQKYGIPQENGNYAYGGDELDALDENMGVDKVNEWASGIDWS